MSDPAAVVVTHSVPGSPSQAGGWRVRAATSADLPDIAAALAQLLDELGGAVPAVAELEAAARTVIATPELGVVLVADTPTGIIGVLAASRQHAIHVPGPYCLIQDLWVDPDWRSAGVGAALVNGVVEHSRLEGIPRIEVGLPSERFAALPATEAFYEGNGFRRLGPRMRLETS